MTLCTAVGGLLHGPAGACCCMSRQQQTSTAAANSSAAAKRRTTDGGSSAATTGAWNDLAGAAWAILQWVVGAQQPASAAGAQAQSIGLPHLAAIGSRWLKAAAAVMRQSGSWLARSSGMSGLPAQLARQLEQAWLPSTPRTSTGVSRIARSRIPATSFAAHAALLRRTHRPVAAPIPAAAGAFTNQIQKGFEEPRLLIVTDPRTDHQVRAQCLLLWQLCLLLWQPLRGCTPPRRPWL